MCVALHVHLYMCVALCPQAKTKQRRQHQLQREEAHLGALLAAGQQYDDLRQSEVRPRACWLV